MAGTVRRRGHQRLSNSIHQREAVGAIRPLLVAKGLNYWHPSVMSAPLIIKIPGQFSGLTMTRVTNQIVDAAVGGKLPAQVCFNFGTLGFIEPAGLVFLSNLIDWLRGEKECEVAYSGVDEKSASVRYLDDCGFFATSYGKALDEQAAPRRSSMPFARVAQQNSHEWLDGHFIPWLSARLDQSAATLAPLRICVSELLNNIADHTRFNIGGVAAQHFPNANRLQIAIADFGIGIPRSVAKLRPGLSDTDAIIQATEEGFTTQSTPRNRGAGLDYLLRVVPGAGLGNISIYSCDGMVSFGPSNGSVGVASSQTEGFCPGTLIEIEIRTDRIQPVDQEEEELQW